MRSNHKAVLIAIVTLALSPVAAFSDDYYYDESGDGYYTERTYYQDPYEHPTYYRHVKKRYRTADEEDTSSRYSGGSYESRLPQSIASGEKTILVDPNVHAWGAYEGGSLVRAGIATAGSRYCPDIGRPCKTRAGTFRIYSLGSSACKSTRYPVGKGGAPMPYCMYFNGNQGLHGSHEVAEANLSHGCVRLRVSDAEWIRFNFANIGTKVIVRGY